VASLAPHRLRAAWAELEKLGIPKHIATVPGVTLENIKDYMALKMAIYAAMVDRMDQGIGRIVAALRKHGLLENTLILFLADNGGCSEWGVHGFGLKKGNTFEKLGGPESWASYGGGWANASNTPFRYYKHYAHEGGIATPLIVQWPKVVKDTGAWRSQVGHIIDIMPTLLDAAGGAYPKTHSGEAITPAEGVSLLDAFAGKAVERGAPLFWEHHGNRAVRDGKWKTVAAAEKSPWELYDMEADRTEVNDLAASQPAIVKALDAKWQAWAERCNVLPMCPNKKSAYIEARKKEREAREKERRARIEAEKAKKR